MEFHPLTLQETYVYLITRVHHETIATTDQREVRECTEDLEIALGHREFMTERQIEEVISLEPRKATSKIDVNDPTQRQEKRRHILRLYITVVIL